MSGYDFSHSGAINMTNKTVILYRMVTSDHTCPFGLKAKHLLKSKGYLVDDRRLSTRNEADDFKQQHDVKTTPQIFIDDKRIGGYDELRKYFNMKPEKASGLSYQPLYAIFITTALLAFATMILTNNYTVFNFFKCFVSLSMCVLAILKLKDLSTFTSSFLGYDLLAKHYVPYAYMYPFLEVAAGILMFAMSLQWIAIGIALFIGLIGAISVIKAVYIDKRELKCACVGGDSNVPLGAISLIENIMMLVMAVWMLIILI